MKRKFLILLTIMFVLLGAAAYWFYQSWYAEEAVETWAFVPESAVMVYETNQLMSVWEEVSASPLWSQLSSIPDYRKMEQHVSFLDSLHDLESFFKGRQVLIGMHVVARDAFDFSYFFRLSNAGEYTSLKKVLDQLAGQPQIRQEVRTYNSYKINELTDRKTGQRFSYIVHQNIFAGSFTPFLIEDIVRNLDTGLQEFSFLQANPKVQQVPRLSDDTGNLYFHLQKIPLLLSVFAGKDMQAGLQPLSHLAQSMSLDASLSEQQILLNGFTTLPSGPEASSAATLLGTFKGQTPQAMGMESYIPDRTAILVHMTFSDPVGWQEQLYAYHQRHADAVLKASLAHREQLQLDGKFDLSTFFRWFAREAAVLTLESVDMSAPDKVFIVGISDTSRIKTAITQFHATHATAETGQPYEEDFSGYQIREIQRKEFPAALLGPVAFGFDQCFYFLTENYWVMANSVRSLKRLILDRQTENTWNKSLLLSRFLETTVDQANLSYIVNTARAWPLLINSLSPEWREYAQQYADEFRSLERLSVQFSENENEFYTSIAVDYAATTSGTRRNRQFQTLQQTFFENPLATKPHIVKNHNNQLWEVLVQDDSNYVYLTSAKGEILWKDSLPGPMVSDVQQIDFYNNGNLQYTFATEKAIHLLDRNGNKVEGYPLYMPEGVSIAFLSVIDYDNSKNYRFLVGDSSGRLWMFNKDRENLEGWNPRPMDAPLAAPPVHIRVRDRDFILAMEQNGSIHLFNRRGQLYGGFPISLNTPLQSSAFISQSSELKNSVITTITTQGEIIAFNLLGNIMQREQLYRPSTETSFSLSVDMLGKTFVIIRKDSDRLGILNHKGTMLLEKAYISPAALTSGMLEVQYYNFGAGQELFAITDQIQEFAYLFDGKGNLIKERPVESRFGVGVLYLEDENTYRVYRSYADECSVISFSL